MSKDLECPYCNADLEVCHDDGFGYSEGDRHEMHCYECSKNFVFTTSISFYYEPEKADCLNGSPHNLKMSKTYPRRYAKMECSDCDFSRKPTDKEFEDAGITAEELAK